MREILFRGKCASGERWWLYGNLIVDRFETSDGSGNMDGGKTGLIVMISNHSNLIEVTPETVGQYTGLKDKNGVKIFEGDLVEWDDSDGRRRIDPVQFAYGGFYLCNNNYPVGHYQDCKLRVIGNIHDNPELLNERVKGNNNA